ncbi:CRISPR-associated endonuclease Cas2 [Candidatus Peregrinibacteria bacterium]|nr:CRISPR-associated endonuclease Cas2 [Candidatus Peregrinibacteria bacterium]
MLIVAYDFANDKKRTKFAKFLKKYGYRIQYSVFMIRNSKRVLQNLLKEIELKYQKTFTGLDSILIFSICESCDKKVLRYGYAKNEDVDVFFLE